MKEWVRRLNTQAEKKISPEELPGLRLLQFFEKMGDEEECGSRVFETGRTVEISESLRALGPFCGEWLERSFESWGMGC